MPESDDPYLNVPEFLRKNRMAESGDNETFDDIQKELDKFDSKKLPGMGDEGGAEEFAGILDEGNNANNIKVDNWEHRSSGMVCETCMWFARKVKKDGSESVLGRCRKRAPSGKGWVPVYRSDWCGDHRLDENIV